MATSFGDGNIKHQAPNNQIKRNEKKERKRSQITKLTIKKTKLKEC
jgi:hypothetical protein